jgi:hypothetical protein
MVASRLDFREISMHSRPSRPAREGGLFHLLLLTASLAGALAPAGSAFAQGAPPSAKPQPAKPPPHATDMEIDPDAPPPPPPEKVEPPPLPPAGPDAWGVGGKDEEGKFAPGKPKAAAAADDDKSSRVVGPPGAASVDMLIGFGAMRDVTNDSDLTKITVLSFIFGLQYRLGDALTIGARLPYATGSIAGPQGASDDFNTFALGNLELHGRYAIDLSPRLALPIEAAIYFPSASGDLFADPNDQGARAQALVNQAASYSRGFEENPLFASKRMGIRFGGGVTYDRSQIHVEAHTRLDIMGKTGGKDPKAINGVVAELHTPNTTWLTGASFFYDVLGGKLTPGLRTWLAVTTLPVFAGTRDYSGAQLVVEPDLYARLPLDAAGSFVLRGGVGYVLPIAGALGGGQKIGAQNSGSTGGLRVHAEFQF